MILKQTKKLKTEVIKYHKWCKRKGYKIADEVSLIWYFNRKRRIKNRQFLLFAKLYDLREIKDYFIKT